MENKDKKYYGNIILLVIFGIFFFLAKKAASIAKVGGARRELQIIIPLILIFLVLLAYYIVYEKRYRRNKYFVNNANRIVRSVIYLAAILVAIIYSYNIYLSSKKYNGVLSWKIEEIKTHEKVKISNKNLYDGGLRQIFKDLDEQIDFPKKLYISDEVSVRFEEDGIIRSLNTLLYGKNDLGEDKFYIISYDRAKDEDNILVIKDAYVNATYDGDMSLDPLLAILDRLDLSKKTIEDLRLNDEFKDNKSSESSSLKFNEDTVYGLLYYGNREINNRGANRFLDINEYKKNDNIDNRKDGTSLYGYCLSLYVPSDDSIFPIRYIIRTNKESEKKLVAEQNKSAQLETDDKNVFKLGEKEWRLVEIDAALGSISYRLDYKDANIDWSTINERPFLEYTGQAQGIVFFDDEFGFIGLDGKSGDFSRIFVTRDGGKSFDLVELPVERVEKLPEEAIEYGFTIDNFKYKTLPKLEGEKLVMILKTGSYEEYGIYFESSDRGITWNLR